MCIVHIYYNYIYIYVCVLFHLLVVVHEDIAKFKDQSNMKKTEVPCIQLRPEYGPVRCPSRCMNA